MNKIFNFFIESFYWLMIFLSPFLISLGISIYLYGRNSNLIWYSLIILIFGILMGIFIAERIRRKYGCSNYVGRILATPDIWPNDVDSKNSKKNNDSVEKK